MMGWEERNGHRYYYRKVRDGDTVRSEYVGRGDFAQTIAQFEQTHRRTESLMHRLNRHEREEVCEEARQLDELIRRITGLTHAALLTSGFHTHKGQWRKQRE